MLSGALAFLREELSRYLIVNQKRPGQLIGDNILVDDQIILGNIAALENDSGGEATLRNRVVISLVNIEEESALKNGPHFIRNPIGSGIEYTQPPVHLNLYLLFCATLPDQATSDDYERSLNRLSLIIEFFQSKKSFTVQNSPQSSFATDDPGVTDEATLEIKQLVREELRLLPELYTLTFEQINHLWGSLGGKQVPFVMYKVRLVKIQGRISSDAPLIEEIQERREDLATRQLAQIQDNQDGDQGN
ncbi:MAG: DUF4255 domain-containing protein [Saprospiraceae bacterium]|jgi:hypothetical protein|nr:DUF4255 domain-containing protein [Saprospiraceae bacterium]